MKPRESLNQRKKNYMLITGIAFGLLAVLAFVEKYLPKSLFDILAIGAGTVFVAGIFLVYWGIKCPKCSKVLGLKFVYADDTLIHCPRCGIPFDEDSL